MYIFMKNNGFIILLKKCPKTKQKNKINKSRREFFSENAFNFKIKAFPDIVTILDGFKWRDFQPVISPKQSYSDSFQELFPETHEKV